MKRDNIQKGMVGQQAAVKHLKKNEFKIVELNYRTRYGEIDIVASKDERIVFIEVKTKSGERFGEPWEMVDKRKLGQIKRIAKMYLIKNNLGQPLCRIDVIGVWLNEKGGVEKLKHWKNVT